MIQTCQLCCHVFLAQSICSYSMLWKTALSFLQPSSFHWKQPKGLFSRLPKYRKNRASKCQPTHAVVPCSFWTSLQERAKAITCAAYVLPAGMSIFLPWPVSQRQEWTLLSNLKTATRVSGQVNMNISNNNRLLSHCCLRHLADAQGSQKRLSLSRRRGLKVSCCA